MNPPAPRKLHIPGKLVITPPEPKPEPPPPPACVEARRRFIKYFLAITGALTLLGNLIAIIRCGQRLGMSWRNRLLLPLLMM